MAKIAEFRSDKRRCRGNADRFIKGEAQEPFDLDITLHPGLAAEANEVPNTLTLVVKVVDRVSGELVVDPHVGEQNKEPPVFSEFTVRDLIGYSKYHGSVDISCVEEGDFRNRYFLLYDGDVNDAANLRAKSFGDGPDEIISKFIPVRKC